MGWTGTHKETGENVKTFFEGEFNSDNGQVLDCAVVNFNEAYLAYKNHNTGQIVGIVCLLHYDSNNFYNLYYKDIDEGMGPFSYNCPAKILDQLTEPPPNDWAATWREKCRQKLQNKQRNNKLKDGNVIQLSEPLEFTDGSFCDTFVITKQKRKTLFYAAKQDGEGNWKANPYMLYKITRWKEKDFQVIA